MPSNERPLWNARDWWEELAWPRVARSPLLGLRPSRVLTAFFALLACAVIFAAGAAVDRAIVTPAASTGDPSPAAWLHPHWNAAVLAPWKLVRDWPVSALLAFPTALVIAVVAAGSIARGGAMELADRRVVPWASTIGYAVARWRSLAGALLAPIVAIWLIAFAIAVFGLMMRVPGLDLAGAMLYGLALGGGMIATVLSVIVVLGGGLMIVAVVVDDADMIGAVERAAAYTLGGWARLVAYVLLAGVVVASTVAVAATVVVAGSTFAARSTQVFGGERGTATVWSGTLDALSLPQLARGVLPAATSTAHESSPVADMPPSQRMAARVVRLWISASLGLVVAAGVSMAIAGMTGVYLGLRRACDGLDFADVDGPAEIRRSMSRVLESRRVASDALAAAPLDDEP